MKIISKNVQDILRIESPPFRKIEYATKNDGTQIFLVTIRFAFDAIRVANEGNPIVTLTLRDSQQKTSQKPLFSKNVSVKESSKSSSEALLRKTNNSTEISKGLFTNQKKFSFDLSKSIPEDSNQSLKNGNPIRYDYLKSIKIVDSQQQQAIVNKTNSLNDKEYLLSLVSKGIDPATIGENFPSQDPLTGQKKKLFDDSLTYYTKKISKLSEIVQEYIVSNFLIFEQQIELTQEEFSTFQFYEFVYKGNSSKFLTRSKVSTFVNVFDILSQINSYTLSNNEGFQNFVKRQDSYFAILPESFTSDETNFDKSNKPIFVRRQEKVIDGKFASQFSSKVIGKISSSNGKNSKTARQEPDIFPFYVESLENDKFIIAQKLPHDTKRVEVLARKMSNGQEKFKVVASSSDITNESSKIQINSLQRNSTYEFKLKVYDSRQRSILSSNTTTFVNNQSYQGAKIKTTEAKSVGGNLSSISIGSEFTDSGRQDLTNLLSQLTSAGISDEVILSLKNDPTLYSQIFSFRVETNSLSKGIQVYSKELSLSQNTPSTEFLFDSSDPQGTVVTISLGLKSPDALIPLQSFFKFGKFGGLYRKSQPSNSSLEKNKKSGENFEYIDTGIKTVVFVPPQDLVGNISEIFANKTFRNTTLLRWDYFGDLSKVDHFQIFGASGEDECLLGCSFKSLSFEDFVLSNRVGVVKYAVRPVYIDLRIGESAFIYQETETTLDVLLTQDFRQGQSWNTLETFTSTIQQPQPRLLQNDKVVNLLPNDRNQNLTLNVPSPPGAQENVNISIRKNFASKAPSTEKFLLTSMIKRRIKNGGK